MAQSAERRRHTGQPSVQKDNVSNGFEEKTSDLGLCSPPQAIRSIAGGVGELVPPQKKNYIKIQVSDENFAGAV